MYRYGYGVARNPGEALRLYKAAADRGLALAQKNAADMYSQGQRHRRKQEGGRLACIGLPPTRVTQSGAGELGLLVFQRTRGNQG
ncbi:MAG: hypothetical protein MZW92_61090 [Comamonadaceae bacterium]|nr:hypothetical protein [Comamonadaceae bacterium]